MASEKDDNKVTLAFFWLIFKFVFKWGWPLWIFAIINGSFHIGELPAKYLTPLLEKFLKPPTLYRTIDYIEKVLFFIWWSICFGPIADLLNARFGEVIPGFRMLYHRMRDGAIGRVLGGRLGFLVGLFIGGAIGKFFGATGAVIGGLLGIILTYIYRRKEGVTGKAGNGPLNLELDRKLIKEISENKPERVLSGYAGGEPVFTTDKQRIQHTQVIGSSGSGKTESVIKNWAYQDLARGKGFALLDPKGDVKMASELFYLGSGRKIYYLSLVHDCKYSQTYNPLAYGDPSQCANKIFNSFDWESDYYKMRSFDFYQSLLRILFRHCGEERGGGLPPKYRFRERVLLGQTLPYLRDPRQCEELAKTINDPEDRAELAQFARTRAEDLSGLYSKLSMLCRSETVSKVFAGADINVKDIVDAGDILLCQLPTAAYTIEARAIARMIIQDLNLVSAYRQQDLGKKEFYPVFIDEFNSFIFDGFLDFLEKARSANMGLVLAHQSLANLERINPAFKKQIFENCSTKIIMSHNDPDSAKYIAQAIGEYYHQAKTHTDSESSEVLGIDARQGKAVSVREEKRFIVEPTSIMSLHVGEGYYLGSGGSVARIQMRHFGPYYSEEMYSMDFLKNIKKGVTQNADSTQTAGPARPGNNENPGLAQVPDGSNQNSQDREERRTERGEAEERTAPPQDKGNNSRPEF